MNGGTPLPFDGKAATGLLALQSLDSVGPAKARAYAQDGALPPELEPLNDELDAALAAAEAQVAQCSDQCIEVLSFFDDVYPQRLRDIAGPPAVLYARGDTSLMAHPKLVAIVGTRSPTVFGVTAAEVVMRAVADVGGGLSSGLALGIDQAAHGTALESDAPNIAILGSGLDNVTPIANRGLAQCIIDAGGLLLSEQPLGTAPSGRTLVARNRLQTGLAVATVVGQTDVKSGTMHTARFSLEQSRPLWVARPRADDLAPASRGSRLLLEAPAQELPERIEAFKSKRALCRRLGPGPAARPISRETLDEFAASLAS